MKESAQRTTPPYPDHECEGCSLGRKLVVSPMRVGDLQAACHSPEGWVCWKYMPPRAYEHYQREKAERAAKGDRP